MPGNCPGIFLSPLLYPYVGADGAGRAHVRDGTCACTGWDAPASRPVNGHNYTTVIAFGAEASS